jgi:hypothetical protein
MGEAVGRIISALGVCLILSAAPAWAGDFPVRKAGLWEITIAGAHSVKVRQCSNAASDEAMAQAGIGLPGDCAKHNVQQSGNTITIDSVCKSSRGKPTTSHIVITGSLDSKYTMTMSSQEQKRPVTLYAEWLGPCGAGQKPGDVIMPDGMKVNLLSERHGPAGH